MFLFQLLELRNGIQTIGDGLIAQQVRTLVGTSSHTAGERPSAIVDTTGDPAVIVDATRRVTDMGRVVLVGESCGRKADINLYPDVHVRGLTLVGVARPLLSPLRISERKSEADLVRACREALSHAALGAPLSPGAAWYRVG